MQGKEILEKGNKNQSRMETPEEQFWKLHSLLLYEEPAPMYTNLTLLLPSANIATFSCFLLILRYSETLGIFSSRIETGEQ